MTRFKKIEYLFLVLLLFSLLATGISSVSSSVLSKEQLKVELDFHLPDIPSFAALADRV